MFRDGFRDPLPSFITSRVDRFAALVDQHMADAVGDDDGSIDTSRIDEIASHLNDAFTSAAKECLPESAARANRPWVRTATLALDVH